MVNFHAWTATVAHFNKPLWLVYHFLCHFKIYTAFQAKICNFPERPSFMPLMQTQAAFPAGWSSPIMTQHDAKNSSTASIKTYTEKTCTLCQLISMFRISHGILYSWILKILYFSCFSDFECHSAIALSGSFIWKILLQTMRCRGANSLQFNQCFFCCPIPHPKVDILRNHAWRKTILRRQSCDVMIMEAPMHQVSGYRVGLEKIKTLCARHPWSNDLLWVGWFTYSASAQTLNFFPWVCTCKSIYWGARAGPNEKSLNFFSGRSPTG